MRENGKVFAVVSGSARVVSGADFVKLSKDVESVDPRDATARKALEARVTKAPRTYWIDVTEPFAHNAELEKSGVKPPKDFPR